MMGVPILHVGRCGTPGGTRPLPELLQEFWKLDDNALELDYPLERSLWPPQPYTAPCRALRHRIYPPLVCLLTLYLPWADRALTVPHSSYSLLLGYSH